MVCNTCGHFSYKYFSCNDTSWLYLFLHYANTSNTSKIIYAESGKTLNWPMGEYESTTTWFEMDGTKYVKFREGFSDETFFLDSTDNKRGEPVANIRFNHADSNIFNDAMVFLLTGSTRDKLDVSTIYPLINENGFEFFEVNGTAGNDVFCPESKLDTIKAYYANDSNYDTLYLSSENSVKTDRDVSGERRDTPYINNENNVMVDPKAFEELRKVFNSGQSVKRIEIPQKHFEIGEAAQPDTPIFGYDEREFCEYSKDKLAYKLINLVLIEDQVYIEQGSGNNYIDGYPLSDEINQYIINTFFVN